MKSIAHLFIWAIVLFISTESTVVAQQHILRITEVDIKRQPSAGDWRVGMVLRQLANKDNQDSWHGGESKFEGPITLQPVDLKLSGIKSGEQMSLFIGIDDDADDAGNESRSEDKLYIDFKAFSSGVEGKQSIYTSGEWLVVVHYTLME